jgi:hypothetical protein
MLLLRVIDRNESVQPQYGDAYTCLLILDTNVARFDIFKSESKVSETELDVEISTDVCKCGTVTSKSPLASIIPLIADVNGQFRNRIKMRIPLVRAVYFSTRRRRKFFFPEYSRRSEEGHLSVSGGFCVGVPPQTGLIGVRNPRAYSDGSIFRP